MSNELEARIVAELTEAMRASDEVRKRTLRCFRAAIKNAEIEAVGKKVLARGEQLGDPNVLLVLQKQAKQRRDSIEQFVAGDREDLAAIERVELAIIEAYLPRQLSEDEIETTVRAQAAALGAEGPSDMGKLMGPVMKALSGRADGKVVSAVVRRVLSE